MANITKVIRPIMRELSIKLDYCIALFFALLFMSFFTAPLFDYSIVRFSDVGAVIVIFLGLMASRSISFGYLIKLLVLFVVIAIFNTFIHSVVNAKFDPLNALLSFFRILIGVSCAVFVVNLHLKMTNQQIVQAIYLFIKVHCYVMLTYAVIFFLLDFDSFFKIVTPGDERNRLISESYMFLNHFHIVISSGFYYRLSGLFEEPAWFGWVLTLFIAFILQYQYTFKHVVITKMGWLIIIPSYFLTVSVSAIFGLFFLLFWYLFSSVKVSGKIYITIAFSVFVFVVYLLLPDFILARLSLIAAGGDGSTSSRIVGSLNGAMNSISLHPFIGTGLGDLNRNMLYTSVISNGSAFGIRSGDGSLILDMHNIFFSIVSSLGFFGGALILLLISALVYFRLWILLVGYVVVFWSVNVFDSYLFLVSWGLVYLLFMKRRLSNVT
jgi:hypothetical protein